LTPALVASAALLLTGVATEISWGQIAARGPFGLLVHATGWLAIAVGTVAWARRAPVRLASLLVLLGVALFLRDLRESPEPLVRAIGVTTAYAWTALAAHLALAWPEGVLPGRGTRALVTACYACALGTQLMRVLNPGAGDAWPLTGSASAGVLSFMVVTVVVLRWWKKRDHEGSSDFIILSAVTIGLIGACVGFLNLGDGSDARIDAIPVVVGLSVLPVAVLAYLRLRAQHLDVQASRRRIVEATMAERRRMQHDIHEGAQQGFVATKWLLEETQRSIPEIPDVDLKVVRSKMAATRRELAKAIGELRTFVQGIYPAVLQKHGLLKALEEVAHHSCVAIVIDVPARRWASELEITAYFCVKEVIVNALKHAEASRIDVTAHDDDTALVIRIQDDGRGEALPPWDGGVRMLQDRVETLGGRITDFRSIRGKGTFIALALPHHRAAPNATHEED
jgi:signal transduction histidine kinase